VRRCGHHIAGTGPFNAASRSRARSSATSVGSGCEDRLSAGILQVTVRVLTRHRASPRCHGTALEGRSFWGNTAFSAFVSWAVWWVVSVQGDADCDVPIQETTGAIAELYRCVRSGKTRLLWSEQLGIGKVVSMGRLLRCLTCGLLAPLGLVGGAGAVTMVLDRYAGSFTASGTIMEGPDANSHQVRCHFMASRQGATGLFLRGTCRAYLVLSRSISVDLTLDPRSGRVTGAYTGSRVGTAKLEGRQTGPDLDLTLTWPTPLYGDTTANLRVASLHSDRYRIVVMDRIGTNGPVRATTDLTLVRR
jgi:hypothetical protein